MDKDKIFLLTRGDLEKRLDPFYYIPSLVALESKVLAKKPLTLKKYILKMSSGATPSLAEEEKYYSNKENGYSFLRVQNLNETGNISLEDVKYINEYTHTQYLKRSQVAENDLLIKITGVGRMAIAGVPPKGFEGNINQHIVVAKTKSRNESEILASFLNSDVGEKLASRRATGGTRPALDYPSLKSIPIVFNNRIVELSLIARDRKERKEAEAQELLKSIDEYLLTELGIKLPPSPDPSIENRIFRAKWKSISGGRFDATHNQEYFNEINVAVKKGKLNCGYLKEIMYNGLVKGYLPNAEEKEGQNKVIQINSINSDGSFDLSDLLTAKDVFSKKQKLLRNDILVVITGATIGKIGYWQNDGDFVLGGDIVKFQTAYQIDPFYVFSYLRSKPAQIEIKRNITGATNGHLSLKDVNRILIPVPSNKKEYDLIAKISEQVKHKREQAFLLQKQAKNEFIASKKEIEKLILE